jgi:hypothetical protein
MVEASKRMTAAQMAGGMAAIARAAAMSWRPRFIRAFRSLMFSKL